MCVSFLKKEFKKGEPCGDVVRRIMDGTDGHGRKRPGIMQKLKTIAAYAEGDSMGKLKICRYCNKMETSEEFQMSLMKCSRCKNTFYCSQECQ